MEETFRRTMPTLEAVRLATRPCAFEIPDAPQAVEDDGRHTDQVPSRRAAVPGSVTSEGQGGVLNSSLRSSTPTGDGQRPHLRPEQLPRPC